MKISYSWLQDHIDIERSPEELADILTRIGLEVDEHGPTGGDPEALEGLIVGKVNNVTEHPNADKLVLTKVDLGEKEVPIVCGAPNVREGQKVVVAPPGSTVHPIRGDPFKIKKAKIRGELSEGMICSASEIGTGEDHEGIMVLDEEVNTGQPVRELFEDSGDHLFEIDITPNRADAISVLGVARDIDAYIQVHEELSLRKPLQETTLPKGDHQKLPIEVEVEDEEACPRYCGLSISGLRVEESPDWLQEKLKRIGAVPINNVVDVTNYVLHEIGQPLHAFDAAAIKGSKVIVGQNPAGTKFTTLDEEERELAGSELMICNGEKEGMCMAGILGGAHSGVSEGTETIFLESAYFDPATIRRSASRHGLSTEASFRFERGVDPEITRFALERAASLILEVAGGELSSEVKDTKPEGFEWARVDLEQERIAQQVGEPIGTGRILKILRALEMRVEEEGGTGIKVSIPPFRVDVTREADLLEEILRIHGYDRVGLPDRLWASVSQSSPFDVGKLRRTLAELLAAHGCYEIASNSLVDSDKGDGWHDPEREVRVLNPISSELDVLRQSMVHSALPVLAHNIKRKETELRLFEFGKVYWMGGSGYEEEERLALYMSGGREPENWRNRDEGLSYFDLKGAVHRVLERTGLLEQVELRGAERPHIREGGTYRSTGKPREELVEFGELDPDIREGWDIDQPVMLAEFRLGPLFAAMQEQELRYHALSKHLPVRKDMAFILDKGHRFDEVRRIAFEAENELLREVDVFDVYEGDKIGDGKVSYALKFIFHDEKKTLEDSEIEKAMERIGQALKQELGAELRDH
ncbi:MAG: phenylalanine--tRNA ligase subunit beta [Flavobacteriales bacterium]